MDLYNWAGIPVEKMTPLLSRQVFHTERMTIARLIITKGAIVPLHHHEIEQVSVVDSGTLGPSGEISGEGINGSRGTLCSG